ncbi:MAG: HEAT repeat domain-containing protein [Nitrospira sp.]|nr:HEAT repeat domain-containing protein [Nitrospira sp.]
MKISRTYTSVIMTGAVFITVYGHLPMPAEATSLRGIGSTPEKVQESAPQGASATKKQLVGQYTNQCANKPAPADPCDKIRKDAIEIFKEDLQTLGSSTDRTYLPVILGIFKSHEPELRIAAADAIGMIGPQDQDVDALAPLVNDPVPDVRRAVSQAISHGKSSAIRLLSQRTPSMKMGLAPETPADAAKYSIPVAPDSTYLFYGSDAASGRLSYTSKNEAAGFFKGRAKTGPFKLDDFQEKYRYQLQDEQEAREQIQKNKAKQLEQIKPDPRDAKALTEFMEQVQSVQMSQFTGMQLDSYQPALFKEPTVYILEERQIGQRSYPTRYVVIYQDVALNRPGYRLNWMTVPDDLVKTAQVASIVEEKEELARKKESEALKKRAAELDALTKKKDEAEKKQFKKGQADLEKELGF